MLDALLFRIFAAAGDWAPLWAGARAAMADPSGLYDFDLVTRLQEPLLGALRPRPFVYPPSALLFLSPFALLPFQPSFLLFLAATGALYAWASFRIRARPLLLLLAPPVVLAALVGQTVLLVAGLAVAGLAALRAREIGAGMLLGLGAAVKPTLFALAPLALLAGRHYRALASFVVTVLAAVVLSILLFGHAPWLAWIEALPRFQSLFLGDPSLVRTAATPYAAALRLGVEARLLTPLMALLAGAAVVFAFRRSEDPAVRLAALFGGALLLLPYAMNYELALLAPAVATLPVRTPRDAALPALFAVGLFLTASVVSLLAVLLAFLLRAARRH